MQFWRIIKPSADDSAGVRTIGHLITRQLTTWRWNREIAKSDVRDTDPANIFPIAINTSCSTMVHRHHLWWAWSELWNQVFRPGNAIAIYTSAGTMISTVTSVKHFWDNCWDSSWDRSENLVLWDIFSNHSQHKNCIAINYIVFSQRLKILLHHQLLDTMHPFLR